MKRRHPLQAALRRSRDRLRNPLSNGQLEDKFRQLVAPVPGAARARDITRSCWGLASLQDMRTLTALCRP